MITLFIRRSWVCVSSLNYINPPTSYFLPPTSKKSEYAKANKKSL